MFLSSSLTDLKLLLVEDDEDDVIITRDFLDELAKGQYELDWVSNAEDARKEFARDVHHLCLMDYRIGPDNGLRLLEEAPTLGFNAPIILLTGQDDREVDLAALKAGAVDYLVKSQLTSEILARAIRYAVARRETEEERSERRRAETENRAKSEFLAHLSHELRTPLTAILGYTDLLLSEEPEQRNRTHLEIVKRNGNHLLGLLNDVLDLSKIEAGRLEIDPQEVDLNLFLADLASLLSATARDKDLDLTIRADGPIPSVVSTDPLRFRQILLNLISNGIKFTDRGEIRVLVDLAPPPSDETTGNDRRLLRIAVTDTGIGLSPKDQKRLFRPFVQVGNTGSARRGGTGLGLAISRQLASRLGGELQVKSAPGKGSTFTVTIDPGDLSEVDFVELSLDAVSNPAAKAVKAAFAGRVLVADDVPEIRDLVGYMVRRTGAKVVQAVDGLDAVEKFQAGESEGRRFDLVMMDVMMPNLNGLEATRLLREQGTDVPIVALTAASMSGERERCFAAGCTAHLSKPIDERSLLGTIERYLPRAESSAPQQPPSRLLLVEDDADARDATGKILGLLGWEVIEAGTGEEALRATASLASPPELALVDLSLPDIDGYELVSLLRDSGLSSTQFVSLSGLEEDRERAMDVGIDQHLRKPLGIDGLKRFTEAFRSRTADSP